MQTQLLLNIKHNNIFGPKIISRRYFQQVKEKADEIEPGLFDAYADKLDMFELNLYNIQYICLHII